MKDQNSRIIVSTVCGIIILASIINITTAASFYSNFRVALPSVTGISDIPSRNSSSDARTDGGNEDRHDIMPMEQITDRFGTVKEVLHDTRMMIEVNDFELTDPALNTDNFSVKESMVNKFLMIDLSIRNIDHTLKISPSLFKLKTGTGDVISPSAHTSRLDAGLREIYLPNDETIRTLLLFEHSSFVSDSSEQPPPVLEYSDGMSVFSIKLLEGEAKPSRLLGDIRPVPEFIIGEPMSDGSLQILATVLPFNEDDKEVLPIFKNDTSYPTKISTTLTNVGNSTVHVEPSYLFILDNKSYAYGIDKSLTRLISSPLAIEDLTPSQSVSGSVVIDLPKNASNLTFLYAGPNNSFVAKM